MQRYTESYRSLVPTDHDTPKKKTKVTELELLMAVSFLGLPLCTRQKIINKFNLLMSNFSVVEIDTHKVIRPIFLHIQGHVANFLPKFLCTF